MIFCHYFMHIGKPAQAAAKVSALICCAVNMKNMEIDIHQIMKDLFKLKIYFFWLHVCFATCE